MKIYLTNSVKETKEIAKGLAGKMRQGTIALNGSLGAGKTTFVQGFAEGLGIREKIISPTFIIVRQHKIPKSERQLLHIDLYRLENKGQIRQLGLTDFFNQANNLTVVEWAERAKEILPKDTVWISIESLGNNKRKIEIS